jgi:hypothetical protein
MRWNRAPEPLEECSCLYTGKVLVARAISFENHRYLQGKSELREMFSAKAARRTRSR